jgi:hypothetical protein
MSPSIADLLLNRPVMLPDGTVWTHGKRRSDAAAEHAREREAKRKREAKAQARKQREGKA